MRAPLLAVLSTVLVAGCGGEPAAAPSSAEEEELGLEHVHGLGVDPSDGMLYAATHFGVFRLPDDGQAFRIAERFQDTMGFTVVGPRTFLASGHPDFRKDPDLPVRLGLIRSDDAAQTWTPVSLSGEADFHALRYVAGTLYAADSRTGRLLASSDEGATWDVRSTVPALDVAAAPDDAQLVVVTTESGLQRSTDGGRTFTSLDGPALVLLSWATPDALYGVDSAGGVHVSADGGSTWQALGSIGGPPEAFTASGNVLYAAARDRGVLQSQDGGTTWSVRYAGD